MQAFPARFVPELLVVPLIYLVGFVQPSAGRKTGLDFAAPHARLLAACCGCCDCFSGRDDCLFWYSVSLAPPGLLLIAVDLDYCCCCCCLVAIVLLALCLLVGLDAFGRCDGLHAGRILICSCLHDTICYRHVPLVVLDIVAAVPVTDLFLDFRFLCWVVRSFLVTATVKEQVEFERWLFADLIDSEVALIVVSVFVIVVIWT